MSEVCSVCGHYLTNHQFGNSCLPGFNACKLARCNAAMKEPALKEHQHPEVCWSSETMQMHKASCAGYGADCDLEQRCPECHVVIQVSWRGMQLDAEHLVGCSRIAIQRTEQSDPSDLERWWTAQAAAEAPEVARKAAEYGSNSLAAMGAMLVGLREPENIGVQVDETRNLELGCFAYAYGKIQRALDAYQRGELPSEDTWRDIARYSKMVLRIREVGSWPGDLNERRAAP